MTAPSAPLDPPIPTAIARLARLAPGASAPYHWAQRLEREDRIDPTSEAVAAVLPSVLRTGRVRDVLGGRWLGHSLHPLLTDLPIGAWTSATLLDLFGGPRSRTAATGLVAFGVAAAVPTAVTGLSDWLQTDAPERRVGVVHAAANGAALGAYALSLAARLRGHPHLGTLTGLVGATAVGVGGFLGSHLSLARGVSTDATIALQRSRPEDVRPAGPDSIDLRADEAGGAKIGG